MVYPPHFKFLLLKLLLSLWMLLLFCFPSGTAPMKHFQKLTLSSGSLTWLRHLLLQAE